jgi:hypothetical protein
MDPTQFMDVSQYMRPKEQVTDDTKCRCPICRQNTDTDTDTDSSSETSSPLVRTRYVSVDSSDSDSGDDVAVDAGSDSGDDVEVDAGSDSDDDDVKAAEKLGIDFGKTKVRRMMGSGEWCFGVVVRRSFPFYIVQFGSEEAKFTAAQLQRILEWDAKEKRDRLRRRMPYVISRQLILRKAPSGGGPIGRFVRRHYLPDSEELFRVVVSFL